MAGTDVSDGHDDRGQDRADSVSTYPCKQPTFEKRLHGPAAIGDHKDDDTRVDYPVDQAKLPEQDLSKLLDAQPLQLPRYGTAFGNGFQGVDDRQELADQGVGVGVVAVASLQAVSVNFFKIVLGALREIDAVSPRSHRPGSFARNRAATSRAALVRPASTSC
jgi:hypothetical protein